MLQGWGQKWAVGWLQLVPPLTPAAPRVVLGLPKGEGLSWEFLGDSRG